ncbi:MAG: hypothetical protein R2764_19475, partial [Bacteroidales bacterium]
MFREGESGVYIGTETDYGVIGYSSPTSGGIRFKLKPASTVFSGRVGILSTGDPDYTFHIKEYGGGDWLAGIHNLGTNTSDKGLLVRSDGGDPFWVQYGASTLFAIKNTGNVGIGTTEPDNRLVIKSPGAGDVFKILSNTNNTLAKFRHTGNGSGSLYLYDDSNNNTVFLYGLGTSFINGGSLGLGTS